MEQRWSSMVRPSTCWAIQRLESPPWHGVCCKTFGIYSAVATVRKRLKRYVLLAKHLTSIPQPTPLRLIYSLNRAKADSGQEDSIEAEDEKDRMSLQSSCNFSQTNALMHLHNQVFHARMYQGMDAEAQLFMQAAALARTVPMYALIVPDGIKVMAQSLKEVDLMQPESMRQPTEAT